MFGHGTGLATWLGENNLVVKTILCQNIPVVKKRETCKNIIKQAALFDFFHTKIVETFFFLLTRYPYIFINIYGLINVVLAVLEEKFYTYTYL